MIKWLEAVDPKNRAVDVAARSLESRLRAVRMYLQRSVKKPQNPENVHQLRVWSRRTDAAIRLYADLIPNRPRRKMLRMIKRIRRAAGRVRDVDVFGERFFERENALPKKLQQERNRAQRKLAVLYDKLDRGRKLKRRSSKLIEKLLTRNEHSKELFGHRARESFRRILNSFFSVFPTTNSTDAELHRFRIAGKDVRYAMELLGAAFPPEFRNELYPKLVAIQESLGQINDLSIARERLLAEPKSEKDSDKWAEASSRVLKVENELALARKTFHGQWTAEAGDVLRTQFEQILTQACNPRAALA